MASISQLYRSLTVDGHFDKRDAAQLLDEAARDGVRDAGEDRELRDLVRALQTDTLTFEAGAARDFSRFATLRDGQRFVEARAAVADGHLDAAEIDALLAGPSSRDQLEDARALLDAGELSARPGWRSPSASSTTPASWCSSAR